MNRIEKAQLTYKSYQVYIYMYIYAGMCVKQLFYVACYYVTQVMLIVMGLAAGATKILFVFSCFFANNYFVNTACI